MAKRRTLKRCINRICEELLIDCIATSLYGSKEAKTTAETLFYTIAKIQKNYVSRISHAEPGMPQKLYFRDLLQKFIAEASDVADQLNSH